MGASTLLLDEQRSDRNRLLQYVNQMQPSEHVALFYSTREDKRFILFSHLKAGLDSGGAGIYIATEETPNQVRHAMRTFGIDVDIFEKSGALQVIHTRGGYVVEGKFSVSKTMEFWKRLFDELSAKGFKSVRVAAEMAYFFKNRLEKEALKYEKLLGKTLGLPSTAICAYNYNLVRKTAKREFPIELVKAHGAVIFALPESSVVKSF